MHEVERQTVPLFFMPKERTIKKVALYELTLKSVGRVFKSKGNTLAEALGKIKIGNGAKAMCVLTVKKGDQTKERILNGIYAHRLFSEVGPTMKEIAIKKVTELIGI